MMGAALARLRRGLRRYGLSGSGRRAFGIARELVQSHSTHVWYQLPLNEPRPARGLDPAFELVQASAGQVELLDGLWAIGSAEAHSRLAHDGTLWLVLDEDRPVFSCWTFRRRTPIRAARGGWLDLPEDTVCLEESMTLSMYRGRGVAPAAWSAIADALEGSARRMVTTVEEENDASRRAVAKAGFREIGRMDARKLGRSFRVVVTAADTPDCSFLRRLERLG